jgi:pyruvate-ferredoxin/flavodoxin oxidoreductase
MGEDINVFVIDTEVYSNTGGQSSKATPLGAVAQFQSSGKKSPKKDLGRQMMPYGNIYIASVAMGADPNQLVKALMEADAYPGPSLVVAYTPCIAHGIKAGMEDIQGEMKRAVESGYWPLYRYDPRKEVPFQLDSKEPKIPYKDFIEGEVRYASLEISFPENADELFAKAEKDAKKRYAELEKLAK